MVPPLLIHATTVQGMRHHAPRVVFSVVDQSMTISLS